jgi:hypothetical protein
MTDADLEATREKAVGKAMMRHSRHFPRLVAEDVTGNGTEADYPLADLAAWQTDYSGLMSVEYPIDEYQAPEILDPDGWMVIQKPTGYFLRLLEHSVPADETFRVMYSAQHTCTTAGCSVNDIHSEALQALAAHFYCRILSAKYVHNSNSTIAADSVDHSSQYRDFDELAGKFLTEYRDHFGIKENMPLPASINVDQDVTDSRGYDRLTHPARLR